MVYKTLFALCIFLAGLRVQSMPISALLPVSSPENMMSPAAFWTSSPQSPSDSSTSDMPSSPLVQISVVTEDVSEEPREQDTTLTWESTDMYTLSTSSEGYLTPMTMEYTPGTPEASVPATGSQSPAESPALTSHQAPASSPPALSTSPPEVPSVSGSTIQSSTETSTLTTGASATPESPAQEHSSSHSSSHSSTSHATSELVPVETTPQETAPTKVTCILVDINTTTPPSRVIMRQMEHALSSGGIATITVAVIAMVLLVFGITAYLKIRHSTYGRLLDDHDYGSWGNYNNPLYDDS